MTPRVLVVQHSVSDGPGRLGHWLTAAGCRLEVVRCHLGEPLPTSLESFAALVVLGGEMGAYDDVEVPWLPGTKELLREAVEADLPTLGVCLGHQLLAVATGGRVVRAATPQQGLTPVRPTVEGSTDTLFGALTTASAVHWNNDVVTQEPAAAVVLARTWSGVQAFRLGASVYGVQFHPEVDVETVGEWARHDVDTGFLSATDARTTMNDITAADEQLAGTWRAFAQRFAALL